MDITGSSLLVLLERRKVLLADLAAVDGEIFIALAAGTAEPAIAPLEVIPAAQAAQKLGVTVRWLNRQTQELRFRCDKNRKCVLYEMGGLNAWWARKPKQK
jgi:hypothetical protein